MSRISRWKRLLARSVAPSLMIRAIHHSQPPGLTKIIRAYEWMFSVRHEGNIKGRVRREAVRWIADCLFREYSTN